MKVNAAVARAMLTFLTHGLLGLVLAGRVTTLLLMIIACTFALFLENVTAPVRAPEATVRPDWWMMNVETVRCTIGKPMQ